MSSAVASSSDVKSNKIGIHDNTFTFGKTDIDLRNFDYFSIWQRDGEARVTLWSSRTTKNIPFSTIVYCECETTRKANQVAALLSKALPMYPDLPERMQAVVLDSAINWGKGNQRAFEATEEKVEKIYLAQKEVQGKMVPERRTSPSSPQEIDDWAKGKVIEAEDIKE